MTRTRRSALGLVLWIGFTLLIAAFHEPWRDEAQAWLVARSASSWGDLILRASMEASGPIYYLLLYPAAKLFPAAYPTGIFLISWVGALLCVALLFRSELLPEPITWLVAFGFLFGYEYSVLARLYGWGCFLLLLGIWGETRGKRWAPWPLALACLVQLSFVFAVAAWCADRCLRGRKPLGYWPIATTCGPPRGSSSQTERRDRRSRS